MPARRHQTHVTSLLPALLALLDLKTDACLGLRVASSRTLDIYELVPVSGRIKHLRLKRQ